MTGRSVVWFVLQRKKSRLFAMFSSTARIGMVDYMELKGIRSDGYHRN